MITTMRSLHSIFKAWKLWQNSCSYQLLDILAIVCYTSVPDKHYLVQYVYNIPYPDTAAMPIWKVRSIINIYKISYFDISQCLRDKLFPLLCLSNTCFRHSSSPVSNFVCDATLGHNILYTNYATKAQPSFVIAACIDAFFFFHFCKWYSRKSVNNIKRTTHVLTWNTIPRGLTFTTQKIYLQEAGQEAPKYLFIRYMDINLSLCEKEGDGLLRLCY